MIIMTLTADGEARTLFNDQDIGDTDNDGARRVSRRLAAAHPAHPLARRLQAPLPADVRRRRNGPRPLRFLPLRLLPTRYAAGGRPSLVDANTRHYDSPAEHSRGSKTPGRAESADGPRPRRPSASSRSSSPIGPDGDSDLTSLTPPHDDVATGIVPLHLRPRRPNPALKRQLGNPIKTSSPRDVDANGEGNWQETFTIT